MSSTVRRWLPVVAWILVIYTTIPFVRMILEWYRERWDLRLLSWFVAAALVTAALALIRRLMSRPRELRRGARVWIVAVTAALVWWTFSLRTSPQEAVHFLEYGALAILLHRALRSSIPDVLVFIAGALMGSLVGTVDEIIQWFLPNRVWDWRDLVLNAGAGGLVQLALWRIVPRSAAAISARSVRIVLRLAIAQLLLVTLCLANTPRLVAHYAPLLPGCGHLTSTLNPMVEYGHLHVVPGLGSFKSRLGLDRLETEDRTRGVEVARLVDETRHSYGRFLDTWPVSEDPFTYEMRVHLFARNRNFDKARRREFTGSMARYQLTVSWYENRLLETVFPTTLAHSSYVWKKDPRTRAEAAHDPDHRFSSAAGSHLITIASERAIRAVMLVLVVLGLVADAAIGRYHRAR